MTCRTRLFFQETWPNYHPAGEGVKCVCGWSAAIEVTMSQKAFTSRVPTERPKCHLISSRFLCFFLFCLSISLFLSPSFPHRSFQDELGHLFPWKATQTRLLLFLPVQSERMNGSDLDQRVYTNRGPFEGALRRARLISRLCLQPSDGQFPVVATRSPDLRDFSYKADTFSQRNWPRFASYVCMQIL